MTNQVTTDSQDQSRSDRIIEEVHRASDAPTAEIGRLIDEDKAEIVRLDMAKAKMVASRSFLRGEIEERRRVEVDRLRAQIEAAQRQIEDVNERAKQERGQVDERMAAEEAAIDKMLAAKRASFAELIGAGA